MIFKIAFLFLCLFVGSWRLHTVIRSSSDKGNGLGLFSVFGSLCWIATAAIIGGEIRAEMSAERAANDAPPAAIARLDG